MFGPPPLWKTGNPSFLAAIQHAGLAGNLRLCLDAGDASSYTSGQSWLDRSGNGYDFFRGSTSGSEASDPTFNGSAGGLSSSEYWSFDGGDYFTYDTTNETWMQNLHKDSALFSVLAWVYPGSISAQGVFGTNGQNLSQIGASLTILASGGLQVLVARGDGTAALTLGSLANGLSAVVATTWQLVGLVVDEASGLVRFHRSGDYIEVGSQTYSSPSASNATYTMQIAARGNNSGPLVSGSRKGGFMMWEGVALTEAQMDSIFDATRGRYGV